VGKRAVPDKGKEDGGTVAYPDLLVLTPKIGSGGITSFFWHQLHRDSVLKASSQYETNAS
jgi:hypothetical protein